MSRRNNSEEQDSLDLLLDTVSNVFGGVMFLTLLAALLILTRGAEAIVEPEVVVEPPTPTDDRLTALEIQQASTAIASQQQMLDRLDPDGQIADKVDRLASINETIALAKRQVRRAGASVAQRQQALQDQVAGDSELEQQIESLQQAVVEKTKQVNDARSESERTVRFRPLSRSQSIEAVVLLRYGRMYMLHQGPFSGSINRDEFYILESKGGVTSITPKPHRGAIVNAKTISKLMTKLTRSFPARRFHITIAVWDDSFTEFNPLKDALSSAGYRYRTLTCDSSTRLSNQAAVDPFVQ
ncbi:MAG: hypothetical protein AB8B91_12500 [Rubripirellula sp.]